MKKIISFIFLLWFANWVYDSFEFFHKNEISTYIEHCPFYDKDCDNKIISSQLYKVFPEQQRVLRWNRAGSMELKDCTVKDRENFFCRGNGTWSVMVLDEEAVLTMEELNSGERVVSTIEYWVYIATDFRKQLTSFIF